MVNLTEDWQKLYKKQRHYLYFSPNTVSMIKSKMMVKSGTDGTILLKCVQKKYGMAWTGLIWLKTGTSGVLL